MAETSLSLPSGGWRTNLAGRGISADPGWTQFLARLENPAAPCAALPESSRRELRSIARERDPAFRAEALLVWAQRQENADRLDSALTVYQFLAEGNLAGVSPDLIQRARRRGQAILGGGPLGERVEFLGRRLAEQATDPVMLVGMGMGSAVFSGVRAVTLSRLISAPAGFLTRGFGARALASSAAFLAEVPAFWATTKGLNELRHHGVQRWDLSTNLREVAGLGITLGALKMSGAAVGAGLGRSPSSATLRYAPALQQAGMYGGILLGHYLEERAGLRPHVPTGTALIDGLAMLIQFNVGGRLMHGAFPELSRLSQELGERSRRIEDAERFRARPWLQALQEWGVGPGPGSNLALAAGTVQGRAPAPARPKAHDFILQMSRPGEESSPDSAPGPVSDTSPPAPLDLGNLPVRTGTAKGRGGRIADPFEPRINPPNKVLRIFLPRAREAHVDPQQEILSHTPFGNNEIQKVNPEHLGRGLGLALQARMNEIGSLAEAVSTGTSFENFPENFRQALISADEMVGMVEYFRRSNQTDVLESFRLAVEPATLDYYETFKQVLIRHLGPHFDRVLEPHEGVLSIGSGNMMALLALYRHRIMPGELSWRVPLMARARQQIVADEINQRGTYEEKIKGIQINYLGDPPIVAVGSKGIVYNGRKLTQADLNRSFRFQILNLTSDTLHTVLTEDYIRDLPPNAILFEVIGGFIAKEHRGDYKPLPHQRETVLAYQLINQALERYGRTDVKVVSGGGFIPHDFLWRGEHVEMVFAGPESEMEEHYAPEADLVARTLAGKPLETGFLTATVSHHQHSTELGKGMKNVTSLMAGYEAALLVHQMIRGAIQTSNPKGEYETQVRNPLFDLMLGVLRFNEGLEDYKAIYRQEVRADYWRCTEIDLAEVERVLGAAQGVSVTDRKGLTEFLTREIFENPLISATRNPKRGIAEYIAQEIWGKRGSPYGVEELLPKREDGKPRWTFEGFNGLGPLMAFYSYRDHPIEQRRLDDRLYRAYRTFRGQEPETMSLMIPQQIRAALNGGFSTILRPEQLRRALEGRTEKALGTLEGALIRLRAGQGDLGHEQNLREEEVVVRLIEAMKNSNPVQLFRVPNEILNNPYGNMFRIGLSDAGTKADHYHTFVRVEGRGIRDRITELGMLLRSFPGGTRAKIELQVTDEGPIRDLALRAELEAMGTSILSAFSESRPTDEFEVVLNRRPLIPDASGRQPVADSYYGRLMPLVERLQRSSPDLTITPQMVRNSGPKQAELLDNLLQRSPAWPLLLGYFGGPINRAIKSAFTRPERGTFIGVFANGVLSDSFMVYRDGINQPKVLSHHLTRLLEPPVPDGPRGLARPDSMDFFEGMDLERFFQLYERRAEEEGLGRIDYRILNIQSLPLESALVDEINGVNAALLRIFLEVGQRHPAWEEPRNRMLNDLAPLYERPLDEVRSSVTEILNRYLLPFENDEGIRPLLDQIGIYKFSKKHGGPGAFKKLVLGIIREPE